MTKQRIRFGAAALLALTAMLASPMAASQTTRSFYMGMTPLPYDFTPDAIQETYQFIGAHSDIIGHHLDEGVPWDQAFSGAAFDPNVEQDIATRLANTPPGIKVFLSVTPISIERNALAGAWGKDSHMPRTGRFKSLDFDHPDVIKAYVNYCRRMIARFRPAYMAYAIEASDLATSNPTGFAKFVKLSKAVYTTLKQENPNLPLFPTFVLGNQDSMGTVQRKAISDLAPYTDVLAVSTYPYVWDGVGGNPDGMGADWFSKYAGLAPTKPFAVAETGFIAEDFRILTRLIWIKSTPQAQAKYVDKLLTEANRLKAEFIVWYVPIDYDLLWEKMEAQGMDAWMEQWRTSGFLDGKMQPRASLQTWDTWRGRTRVPAR